MLKKSARLCVRTQHETSHHLSSRPQLDPRYSVFKTEVANLIKIDDPQT